MGLYMPNAKMPKTCDDCDYDFGSCIKWLEPGWSEGTECMKTRHPDCELIEVDDDLIRMLKESAIVIKAIYGRLKKTIAESDELKKELMGKNADLIIIDEANAIQDVESVGEEGDDDI